MPNTSKKENKSIMKLKHIPNVLSCVRIILVGVFIYLFFNNYPHNLVWAMVVFLTAGITDVIDGFLARRFNWITDLGKVLDPLADKLMQCTVLVCMLIKSLIPAWLVIPFVLKELLILSGGLFMIKKRDVVAVSNVYGKATVVFFYAAVIFCMSARDFLAENPVILYIVCGMVLLVAMSALVNYTNAYFKTLKNNDKNSSASSATKLSE